nr:MAG TPA: hypothetical protein [Caudoviricetes sp.]
MVSGVKVTPDSRSLFGIGLVVVVDYLTNS